MGSKVCNEDEFSMEYSEFNTTYEHNLNLKKEDNIYCDIVSKKGDLYIEIYKDENVKI